MGQHIRPTKTQVRIVPRDGEIEITLNINITVDGKVVASAENENVRVTVHEEEETKPMIPDFVSGLKLKLFGKDS